MKRLSEKEEAVIMIVWELKKAFAKDVRENLPNPKPHINTVATMLKRLAIKGFLKYEELGGTFRYYAAISKKTYTNKFVKPLLSGLFGNSMKNVVAFFAEEEEISLKELKDIVSLIENREK
jgi:predicted transcriptional regulator